MLQVIDSGKSKGGRQGRVWALDPIDGTKGFLRGGQYAVCLALIVDGDVKVGVIGTPNLPHEDNAPIPVDLESMSDDASKYGVLFSAVKGEGAYNAPLTSGALAEKKKITMRPVPSISHAIFCEGVEASHSNHNDNQAVADKLGIANAPVRLDSQAKYCSIARGAGDIYLRLPLKWEYQEKIWDHAAGEILVKEAGGVVSDIYGKPLDFGVGRTLSENKGVIAAPKQVHADIVKATKEVLKVE
ncbi:hypothetical protein KEM55_001901 [Ascosphaera atra]|nr:hypothetical protein KEM55_001901 [Ascosphaera atra]